MVKAEQQTWIRHARCGFVRYPNWTTVILISIPAQRAPCNMAWPAIDHACCKMQQSVSKVVPASTRTFDVACDTTLNTELISVLTQLQLCQCKLDAASSPHMSLGSISQRLQTKQLHAARVACGWHCQLPKSRQIGSRWSPASQESVDDECQVGRLLADGSAEVIVPPLVDQQKLSQACPKDGHAQQGAAEDEGKEKSVVPLHNTKAT